MLVLADLWTEACEGAAVAVVDAAVARKVRRRPKDNRMDYLMKAAVGSVTAAMAVLAV